ncbi:hypothetical protein B296_00004347 [Ensete ventricosum]|uniref:Uncharacterized protein n=1 Tax=Ensete ventricosum TaxID=4639 RepID=A0A426YM78_ENSVE|nr:hypothetical protein B296_00004347 [Ensete ventricosum]
MGRPTSSGPYKSTTQLNKDKRSARHKRVLEKLWLALPSDRTSRSPRRGTDRSCRLDKIFSISDFILVSFSVFLLLLL